MDCNKENIRDRWDKFWSEANTVLSKSEVVDENSWYGLSWKMGFAYWSEVFNRFAPGKKILECGAGSAKISFYMATQGYECVMLDNSCEGLNVARLNFNEAGLNGKFVLGNAEEISFKDNIFDIVYSGGLLNYFDDVHPFVKEMIRVLKPGGLFAATIITSRRFSCQTIGDIQVFWARFIRHIIKGEFKGAIQKSRRNFPFYENSLSLKEYKKILQESGVKVMVATGGNPFPSIALPKAWRPVYAKIMKLFIPFWRWFDRSNLKFTEIWGASFNIYGIKEGKNR